jgi:predicted nucleic acid-binding protein
LTTFVVDSSIVLKWLHEEHDSEQARALSRENLVAPPLLYLEVVNVAARKWRWEEEALVELARQLERSGVAFDEPPRAGVARWAARGLTAYDASYVALAEAHGCSLVTADTAILELAAEIATPLRV